MDRRAAIAAALATTLVPCVPAWARDRPKVVGYLSGGQGTDAVSKAMRELGYVEGRDLRFELRVVQEPDPAKLKAVASELVAARCDALLAFSGLRVQVLAAATRTIPIICGGVPDPVAFGLAETLRRPGANVTGLSWGIPQIAEITIGLLRTLRPGLKIIGNVHPVGLPAQAGGRAIGAAANAAGLQWLLPAIPPDATEAVVERLVAPLVGEATFVAPFHDAQMVKVLMRVATRLRIATVGWVVKEGGLMDYSIDHSDPNARIAALLDKVLRGANPAEMPFELPDRTTFTVNRTAARAIGVAFPPDMMLRVTDVID